MIIVLLSTALVCFVGLTFFQNLKLRENESLYHNALLENSKLAERCSQLREIETRYNELLAKYSFLEKENTRLSVVLDQERKNLPEKLKLLELAEQKLADTFKAIGSDVLSKNNQSFLDLAKTTIGQIYEKTKSELIVNTRSVGELTTPIKTALDEVENKLNELEKSRVGAYEALKQQVSDLISTQNSLKTETHRLVSALKSPSARGHWGEMQLKRVVELAGMLEHCDFEEQVTSEVGDARIRPDMVIYLPGGQYVIVDAKVSLAAYLDSLETNDDNSRKTLLKEHAKQIRSHVVALANKKYWMQTDPSPEFVVMFLPGEVFFSVAVEQDPSLIEFAMQERVIISTPTILLALLHTVAFGWRQENLAENAKQIIGMGQELYKRLADMAQHISILGKSINSTVANYNQTVANIESRVLVTARKFKKLEIHEKNIIELKQIEQIARKTNNFSDE
jgi:DNA recombination protein RmuC